MYHPATILYHMSGTGCKPHAWRTPGTGGTARGRQTRTGPFTLRGRHGNAHRTGDMEVA